jgi:hypothetical protein
MISDEEITRITEKSAIFKPAVLDCRYDPKNDRVELVTSWCTLIVDRKRIVEFGSLSPRDMEAIYASETGIHIDAVDIDINSAGLVTDLCRQPENEVADSF